MEFCSGFSGNAGTRMKDGATFPLGAGLVGGDDQQSQGRIRNLSATEVLASRRRVLTYLLSRYRGAPLDAEFDAKISISWGCAHSTSWKYSSHWLTTGSYRST